MQPPVLNLFIPLIIMSGLNRLFVPDLGYQANLKPLYQSRQADMSVRCDGCHSRPRDGGEEKGKEGRKEKKERWREGGM